MRKLSVVLGLVSLLSFSSEATLGSVYPKSAKSQRDERVGSVLSSDSKESEGGLTIMGSLKKSKEPSNVLKTTTVNPYLWKASLDIISFMPITISDPVGGVISTDWLEDQNGKGERHKINVIIKSSDLKAGDLKVSVFKQILRDHIWRDVKVHESLSHDVEDKILTKARSIKLSQEH
jgi:hypothetical protein